METDVKDLWERAMIDLVLDFPIYANLITRIGCKIVETPTDSIAWTDGKAIYINATTVKKWNEDPIITGDSGKQYNRTIGKKEMMFLLCHELMHLIGLTFDRGTALGISNVHETNEEERAKQILWNKATDYEINAILHTNESRDANGRVTRNPVGKMPEVGLYSSEYRDMPAEKIYEKLYEEYQKNPEGNKQSFTFDGDQTGNAADGLGCSLDQHMPILDDATRSEVISKMSEVFGSTQNGTGESAIDRMLERAFKPQPFNWRRALTKYIRGWMKDNYTWNKPSRAGIANGLILPSSGRTPKMHIGVSVDTSGSIHDSELHTMMDHLFTILQQFKDFQVDVWCCGSEVYPETFRTYTGQNKKDLVNFEFKSDGGNDMRKNFEFIKNKYRGDKLDLFICMSDFYDPLDGDTTTVSPCNCIWLVLDHPDFVPPKLIKAETYPFVVEKSKNDSRY